MERGWWTAAVMRQEFGALIRQATPLLVAQVSSIGMMLIDTALLGHYGAADLGALAVAGGLYISLVFALAGILQSVGPIAAHSLGAGDVSGVGRAFWQGVWLAIALSVPGLVFLLAPGAVLGLSPMPADTEAAVRELLQVLAVGLPVALLYRTFAAFANAVGRTRVLMLISLAGTALHAVLASVLVFGFAGLPDMGAMGCVISTVLVGGLNLTLAYRYLRRAKAMQPIGLWSMSLSRRPDWRGFWPYFRLGVPMGLSNFIEITSFTLIALLVAPLGAEAVAGHRIVSNLSAVVYMVPLSVAIAVLARVAQAAGAQDPVRLRAALTVGLTLSAGVSTVMGVLMWWLAAPLSAGFSNAPGVLAVAVPLMVYVAAYQAFDSIQTVAAYALRGLRVTALPMVIHALAFWGIGLFGGYWLAYDAGQGVAGFWQAAVAATVVAAIAFSSLLARVLHAR